MLDLKWRERKPPQKCEWNRGLRWNKCSCIACGFLTGQPLTDLRSFIGKYNLIRKRLLEEPVAFFGGLGKSDMHLFDSSWGRCWSWVSVPRLTFWFWVVWVLASRGRRGHHNVTLPSLPEPGEESVCQGQSWAPLGLPEAWGGLVSNAWLARRQLQEFKQCNSLVVWHRLPLQRLRTVTTILCWGVECKQHAKSIGCVVSDGGPWGQATQLPPLDRQQRPKLRWYKCHHFRSPKVSPKWFHVWKVIDKLGVSWGYHEIAGPLSSYQLQGQSCEEHQSQRVCGSWLMMDVVFDGLGVEAQVVRLVQGRVLNRNSKHEKCGSFKVFLLWTGPFRRFSISGSLEWTTAPLQERHRDRNGGTTSGFAGCLGWNSEFSLLWGSSNRCLGWKQRWIVAWVGNKGDHDLPAPQRPSERPRASGLGLVDWEKVLGEGQDLLDFSALKLTNYFYVKIGSKLRPSWGGCGSKLRPNFGLSLHVLTV